MQVSAYILLVRELAVFKITDGKKIILPLFLAVLGAGALLIFPEEAAEGVRDGIGFCLNVLVPSLFPFMIISAFVSNSGLAAKCAALPDKPFEFLFGLRSSGCIPLLLAVIGGFPVGACAVSSLYKSGAISRSEAQRAAYFCICSGPGFLINFVGNSLYSNANTGIILYAASVIGVIATGIMVKLLVRNGDNDCRAESKTEKQTNDLSGAVIMSVSDASRSCLDMCAMVVLFTVIARFGTEIIHNDEILKCFLVLTEVTNACNRLCGTESIAFIAFAVGFGGISVHFQAYRALGGIKVKIWLYSLLRIFQGLITSAFTIILLWFFPQTQQVFSTVKSTAAEFTGTSVLGSAALILTAVCFLYTANFSKGLKK